MIGIILFILMYIVSLSSFYSIFFKMRYEKSKEKVKFPLWVWILEIAIICIPIANIICSVFSLIAMLAYNSESSKSDRVEITSIFARKF